MNSFVLGLLCLVPLLAIWIADYVMRSRSMQVLAERRRIVAPWMAWVPILSDWTLGRIVRQYDTRNGQKRRWDITLLVLGIINLAAAVWYVINLIQLSEGVIGLVNYLRECYFSDRAVAFSWIEFYLEDSWWFVLAAFLWAMTLGAYKIVHNICIFKIYESTVPKMAVFFTLLDWLIPLAGSICLMCCKDRGYSVQLVTVPAATPAEPQIPEE